MSDSAHDPAGNPRGPSQDPWASLADELGINPAEPARADAQPPRPAPPPRPKPARPERPPAAARPESAPRPAGWDDLASELGLTPDLQPRPAARPAADLTGGIAAERPIQGGSTRHDEVGRPADVGPASRSHEPPPRRELPPRHEPVTPAPRGSDEPRRDAFPPRDDRRSDRPASLARETRPRTDDDTFGAGLFASGPAAGAPPREPRGAGALPAGRGDRPRRDDRPRADHAESPRPADVVVAPDHDGARPARDEAGDDGAGDRPRRRRGRRGGRGRRGRERAPTDGIAPSRDDEPVRDDLDGPATRLAAPDDLWEGEAAPPEREAAAGEDDAGGPRRRRRGRRGGRGRSRGRAGDRVAGDAGPVREGGNHDSADGPRRSRDVDGPREIDRSPDADRDDGDEPLPGGYGVRPAASRPGGDERSGTRTAEGDGSGRSRRRGRRRRSGTGSGRATGEGTPSEATRGEVAQGGETSRRGSGARRDRRASSEGRPAGRSEGRSESGFSRRRRGDFAPVGSGREEDDEGLEFLSIDEAGAASPRREPRADDEVLVESGLSTVQDVPSWVEAIGIVIAGNLDARNRSPRGDDGRRGNR